MEDESAVRLRALVAAFQGTNMVERRFTHESSFEALICLLCSKKLGFPADVAESITDFVRVPITRQSRFDPAKFARVSDCARIVAVGLGGAGMTSCGPALLRDTWAIELEIVRADSVDRVCRLDVGVVLVGDASVDSVEPYRLSSGVRWHAADGDVGGCPPNDSDRRTCAQVFVAPDCTESGGEDCGWLSHDLVHWFAEDVFADDGLLPPYGAGSLVEILCDTSTGRLGFAVNGALADFRVSYPLKAHPLRFCVSWPSGMRATVRIRALSNFVAKVSASMNRSIQRTRPRWSIALMKTNDLAAKLISTRHRQQIVAIVAVAAFSLLWLSHRYTPKRRI